MEFPYRFGIEEEYFVTDARTRRVRQTMSEKFYVDCKMALGDIVKREALQAQIEIAIPPCASLAEAREHLTRCRKALGECAARYRLAIVAAGTHPLAVWTEQRQTPKARYDLYMADVQMLGLRNMLCGMHVHVEVPDPSRRVEIMTRTLPYLPALLALSASSPFWQGRRTGLHAYRPAAYDELPRTGLPELFNSTEEYELFVRTLMQAGVIKDASFIWWSIRPSMRYPTLELRICDVCPRVDDALCIAAIYRCLIRYLVDHPEVNRDIGPLDRALVAENKWRAQRDGHQATLVDHVTLQTRTLAATIEDLLAALRETAEVLGCVQEIEHARMIVEQGTSAAEQCQVYLLARAAGESRPAALKRVVDYLARTTGSYSESVARQEPLARQ